MTELCPYCAKTKPSEEFTDEHVVPAAVGGNLMPTNPFLIRACKRCNTTCGRHVDGPFVRSWLVSNARASHARRYVDLAKGGTIPLPCMGPLPGLKWDGNDCELWIGPAGDAVYHFHRPYPRPEENAPLVGRPLYARADEVDPGFVVAMIQASNPAWHNLIARSILGQFPDSLVYLGNVDKRSPLPPKSHLRHLPAELAPLVAKLREYNSRRHHTKPPIRIDAGDRILGKLALGIGTVLLGDAFVTSAHAIRLRDFLWGQNAELRAHAEIHGSGFYDPVHNEAKQLLGWHAGHVFVVTAVGNALALNCVFYGQLAATVQITDEPSLWRGPIGPEGAVYVIAPTLQRFSGPHPLPAFVAATQGRISPEAEALGAFMDDCAHEYDVPPYHLDGSAGVIAIAGNYEASIYEGGEKKVLGVFASEREADEAVAAAGIDHKQRTP